MILRKQSKTGTRKTSLFRSNIKQLLLSKQGIGKGAFVPIWRDRESTQPLQYSQEPPRRKYIMGAAIHIHPLSSPLPKVPRSNIRIDQAQKKINIRKKTRSHEPAHLLKDQTSETWNTTRKPSSPSSLHLRPI